MRGAVVGAVLGVVAAIALGCGGGGGASGTTGTVSTGLTVTISALPGQPTTDVPILPAVVTVRASRDLDPTTVNPSNVFLTDATGGLQGNASYNAQTREITFTLTQLNLNPLVSGQAAFNFSTPYTLTVRNVKSILNEPQAGVFTLTFTTEDFTLSVVSSDPVAGSTSACVEEAQFFPAASVTLKAIVLVEVNVDLDPASLPGNVDILRITTGGPTPIAGTVVTYDAPTRTIAITLDPATGIGQNAIFPASPVLDFAKQYQVRIRNTVQTATNPPVSPGLDTTFDFTTAAVPRPPATAPAGTSESADVMINEVLADVPTSAAPAGLDSNKDGTIDATQDEYVELLNRTDDYIDLADLTISEVSAAGNESSWFHFATGSNLSTLLPPRRAMVVFSGGTVNLRGVDMGRSKFFNANRAPGPSLALLNNSPTGDIIRLRVGAGVAGSTLSFCNFKQGTQGAITAPVQMSVNRANDGTSGVNNFAGFTSVPGHVGLCSPGKRADGTQFD